MNKLLSVRNDTKRCFEDIQIMLDILNKEERVDCQLVLKSSLMLMIYNVIEGTVRNLLSDFFDIIVKKKMSLNDLPNRLQSTIYIYYLKQIGNSTEKLKKFFNSDDITVCNISYSEISKYLKLYSGNLDSRLIRETSEKLGIDLPKTIDEPALLVVKNSRNKLAHGKTEFRTACQDMTLDDIKKICDKVEVYLDNLISEYENFLGRL